jgi:hypothetical protein
MMPLGTGNDLARTFRWGPGFGGRMLKQRFLEKVRTAVPVLLDRCVALFAVYIGLRGYA